MNPFVELDTIRLKGEVNGLLIAHYKGSGKKLGEQVMENEVEDILDFKLTKKVNDVFRHAMIIQLKGDWWIFFEFREKGQANLKKAKECLQTAQDFCLAAVILSEQGLYRPAVDSLYSATELANSAQLWISMSQRFLDEKKKKHTTIDQMYSRDVKGPHPLEFHNNFYNLRALKDAGRYMKSKFVLRLDKANENLDATKKMIEHAKKLLKLSD